LILLDLNLPDLHGSDLLVRVRNNPLTAQIPVIVLSADASPSRIERMLQAGARNYLTKPFDIKRLLCLVDETLESAAL
jgi:DNA-binding response OmpR family regulator